MCQHEQHISKGSFIFQKRRKKTETQRDMLLFFQEIKSPRISISTVWLTCLMLWRSPWFPPAFSVMLYFSTSVCFVKSGIHPQYFLEFTGCQRYFLHLDRVTFPGNSFNQTETIVRAWHPNNLCLLPVNVEVLLAFRAVPSISWDKDLTPLLCFLPTLYLSHFLSGVSQVALP